MHYESNARDLIVTRLSIAARSDQSDNVVGVCPSKRTRSHVSVRSEWLRAAPRSRSGRTCLRTKSVFRLCHGMMKRSLEHGLRRFDVTNYLTRSKNSVVPQPPYSPDVASCDFFLFPRLKRAEGKALGVGGEHPSSRYKVPERHSRHGRIVSASVLMQEETILTIFNHLYQSHEYIYFSQKMRITFIMHPAGIKS